VPKNVQNALEIIYVEHVDEVLDRVFVQDEDNFNDTRKPGLGMSSSAVN